MSIERPPDYCRKCGCNLFDGPRYEKRHEVTTLDGRTFHEEYLLWTCRLCEYVTETVVRER